MNYILNEVPIRILLGYTLKSPVLNVILSVILRSIPSFIMNVIVNLIM